MKTLILYFLTLSFASEQYTPTCMQGRNKERTLEKIQTVQRALACRDQLDPSLCNEFLGLGALGVAGAISTAAAMKIRSKDFKICPYEPRASSWFDILIETAYAKSCASTSGLRKLYIQNAADKTLADINQAIDTNKNEIEKLKAEKQKLEAPVANATAPTASIAQNTEATSKLEAQVKKLESAREEIQKTYAASYEKTSDLMLRQSSLTAELARAQSVKGYMDYDSELEDEYQKLRNVERAHPAYPAWKQTEEKLNAIKTELTWAQGDRAVELKRQVAALTPEHAKASREVQNSPEVKRANADFEKEYRRLRERQYNANLPRELKGNPAPIEKKLEDLQHEMSEARGEESRLRQKLQVATAELTTAKEDLKRNLAVTAPPPAAAKSPTSTSTAPKPKLKEVDDELQLRTGAATKLTDAKKAVEKIRRDTLVFKPNLDELSQKLYALGSTPNSLPDLQRLQGLDLLDDMRTKSPVGVRKTFNVRWIGPGAIKALGGKLGIAGLLVTAGTSASASDFVSQLIPGTDPGCATIEDYFDLEIVSGSCQRVMEFGSKGEKFFSLSDADVQKELVGPYRTEYREDLCKLIDSAYSSFYPKIKSVSCGSPIKVTREDFSSVEIKDPQKFPSQKITVRQKTGEEYRLSLSKTGEIVKGDYVYKTGGSAFALAKLGTDTSTTKVDKIIPESEIASDAYRLLLDNRAQLTEVQACCNDLSPRPSDAECGALKVKVSTSEGAKTTPNTKGVR